MPHRPANLGWGDRADRVRPGALVPRAGDLDEVPLRRDAPVHAVEHPRPFHRPPVTPGSVILRTGVLVRVGVPVHVHRGDVLRVDPARRLSVRVPDRHALAVVRVPGSTVVRQRRLDRVERSRTSGRPLSHVDLVIQQPSERLGADSGAALGAVDDQVLTCGPGVRDVAGVRVSEPDVGVDPRRSCPSRCSRTPWRMRPTRRWGRSPATWAADSRTGRSSRALRRSAGASECRSDGGGGWRRRRRRIRLVVVGCIGAAGVAEVDPAVRVVVRPVRALGDGGAAEAEAEPRWSRPASRRATSERPRRSASVGNVAGMEPYE